MSSPKAVVPLVISAFGPFQVVELDFPEGSVGAKQSFKAECDINRIVKDFSQTGEFTHLALNAPSWGDVTGLDFRELLDYVNEAQASFMELPAELRKRFGNDATEFVAFCSDEANRPELERMGLLRDKEGVAASAPPVEGAPSVAPVKAVVEPVGKP